MLPVSQWEAAERDLRAVANAIIFSTALNRVPMAAVAQELSTLLYGWAREGRFSSINYTRVMCRSGDVSPYIDNCLISVSHQFANLCGTPQAVDITSFN
jgi:hypothetical protein